ncbi:MAG: ester cyclase [Pseudomonadota bacterium]
MKPNISPLFESYRKAQYDFDLASVTFAAEALFAPKCEVKLAHPLGEFKGVERLVGGVYRDLSQAFPDLERRDTIVMAGVSEEKHTWIGCCGYYTGTFRHPWLEVPATGHIASLRYHEFYRMEDNQVREVQAIWDIPELMMQSGVWPMGPSLGREWHVPAPASQDGIVRTSATTEASQKSFELVAAMCEGLSKHAAGGLEAMALERYWHPHCSWYGPSGIGSARGIAGFRNWHQIPFLKGMPDRVGSASNGGHMFADGPYVGFTAWPGMHMSITGDGWLGIAPSGQKIEMRSLDFWRCEDGLIRENWVLIDLLHVYQQIGVDVLARMREMTKAKRGALDD